ncbi:hypothetical protein JCM9140_312 [Halalkalibacter wakoensis JCM 9140]|uniref:Uncharacterized protein n=1 Tax=Halalkalibacter wakoensis JCM 9140 TaxID=1236970 RepID=W4PZ32_9BACI|nr:hypothetical protein [Halalkalibacter wakoensis]GAE24394.1 hypothetical protein JCM9140_312 [Halalkalibacter wakoensis JCM 9140]
MGLDPQEIEELAVVYELNPDWQAPEMDLPHADPNGTAFRSNPGHSRLLAGKTGTAELKDAQGTEGDIIGWYSSVDVGDELLATFMVEGRPSGDVVTKANRFWASVGE